MSLCGRGRGSRGGAGGRRGWGGDNEAEHRVAQPRFINFSEASRQCHARRVACRQRSAVESRTGGAHRTDSETVDAVGVQNLPTRSPGDQRGRGRRTASGWRIICGAELAIVAIRRSRAGAGPGHDANRVRTQHERRTGAANVLDRDHWGERWSGAPIRILYDGGVHPGQPRASDRAGGGVVGAVDKRARAASDARAFIHGAVACRGDAVVFDLSPATGLQSNTANARTRRGRKLNGRKIRRPSFDHKRNFPVALVPDDQNDVARQRGGNRLYPASDAGSDAQRACSYRHGHRRFRRAVRGAAVTAEGLTIPNDRTLRARGAGPSGVAAASANATVTRGEVRTLGIEEAGRAGVGSADTGAAVITFLRCFDDTVAAFGVPRKCAHVGGSCRRYHSQQGEQHRHDRRAATTTSPQPGCCTGSRFHVSVFRGDHVFCASSVDHRAAVSQPQNRDRLRRHRCDHPGEI